MRVLGLETSSRRGSVALVENGRVVVSREHEVPSAHAERLLPLVEEILALSGFALTSLDRVAAGIGPGSFTGLRIGLALAEGIAMALDVPTVGVSSLRAMARGVRAQDEPLDPSDVVVCPLLDARREELFYGVYAYGSARDGSGHGALREVVGPALVGRSELGAALTAALAPGTRALLVGEPAEGFPAIGMLAQGRLIGLPHAECVALLGGELEPADHPPVPAYVRGPNATLPDLPPHPLALDREPV